MTTEFDEARIEALIAARIAAREGRDFAEADRIRGELDALGLVIIDEKDPATGKLTTTWRPR